MSFRLRQTFICSTMMKTVMIDSRRCFQWSLALLALYTIVSHAFVVPGMHVAAPLARRAPSFSTTSRQLAVSYESLMEKLPSKPVIEAVEKSSDGKVIASGMSCSFYVSLVKRAH
jgi:hypothetical protein